jgi:hypothetical protein
VAAGWTRLYGFPFDPRLWCAFFLHDIGYVGKTNMDGREGEAHPALGAAIMRRLFGSEWGNFCLYHSRDYARARGAHPSRLCFADKLACAPTPVWLYLPMVSATGEIHEYLQQAQKAESKHWKPTGYNKLTWHAQLAEYMRQWVAEHKDGAPDTWTSADRHACSTSECVAVDVAS